MKNWLATIISQYAKSPKLLALLNGENDAIAPDASIQAFYDEVFNPHTATGWGLDCWGQIVGISRVLELDGDDSVFGFNQSALMPFNHGTFYNETATKVYRLSDDAYRRLIFLKAAINITDGTLKSLNELIVSIFGEKGYAAVLHVGTMHIRFLFGYYLQAYEASLLANENIVPIPAGVNYDVYEIPFETTFGFNGSGLAPFGQGAFPVQGPRSKKSASK